MSIELIDGQNFKEDTPLKAKLSNEYIAPLRQRNSNEDFEL